MHFLYYLFNCWNSLYLLLGFPLLYFSHQVIEECPRTFPWLYLSMSLTLSFFFGYMMTQTFSSRNLIGFVIWETLLIGWGVQTLATKDCLSQNKYQYLNLHLIVGWLYQIVLLVWTGTKLHAHSKKDQWIVAANHNNIEINNDYDQL